MCVCACVLHEFHVSAVLEIHLSMSYICMIARRWVYSHISVRVRMFSGSEFDFLPGWLLLAGLATGQDVQ